MLSRLWPLRYAKRHHHSRRAQRDGYSPSPLALGYFMKIAAALIGMAGLLWLYFLPGTWMRFVRVIKKKKIQFWRRHPDSVRVSPIKYYSAICLGGFVLLANTFVCVLLLYIGISNLFLNERKQDPANSLELNLGLKLPATAYDIKISRQEGMLGGDSYLSAKVTYDEFISLVHALGMWHRPDLLAYWPGALNATSTPWWTINPINDSNTYFSDKIDSTYLVLRYENGRIFFKRHIY